LWVGHFDLSASLGIPGEFDNPKFTAAIDNVVRAANKHKKALGRLVPTVDQGHECNNLGFDFICYSGDVWVLHNALEDAVAKIRNGSDK
ncbi:MAG: hpch/hpai aldolase, partial [SAR324 cluster bacterium]|nr:hpch/hpai aldolase [SAR324 cluster bacterium]